MRLVLLLIFAFFSAGGVLADAGGDQVLQRVVVPSLEKPQGEVRLIRRDDRLVVQTVIASRILKRVVAAIDQKEERRWPVSREGHVDSRHYREELFRATGEVWNRFRQRSDQNENRQYLVIEFILGPKQSRIALSQPQVTGDYGQLQVASKVPLADWRSSELYVATNIREIIQDSFNLDATAADALLEPVWPVRE